MSKRELYKKYVETFGIKRTLLDVIIRLGEMGITISLDYLRKESLNLPLQFSEGFHMNLADVQIFIEVIMEMMNDGEKEQLFTQKHYQLNHMEMAIKNKEKENETGGQ